VLEFGVRIGGTRLLSRGACRNDLVVGAGVSLTTVTSVEADGVVLPASLLCSVKSCCTMERSGSTASELIGSTGISLLGLISPRLLRDPATLETQVLFKARIDEFSPSSGCSSSSSTAFSKSKKAFFRRSACSAISAGNRGFVYVSYL